MPFEVGQRAIRRALRGLGRGQVLGLGLFGGEPLLAWDLGQALIREARALAEPLGVTVQVSLTTNGTRLDASTLASLRAHRVDLALSMDGLPAVHDRLRPLRGGQPSSKAVLAAIDRLVAAEAPFRVISVVRPDTVADVAAGTRFLFRRGVRAVIHQLDYHARWSPADAAGLRAAARALRELWVDVYPRLELSWLETKLALLGQPSLSKPRCGFGQREVAVAPSGRLYPCERLVGADEPGPFVAGHVDDGDGPFQLGPYANEPGAESTCAGCRAEPTCRNGCACANLARSGALHGPDGLICTLEQALLEEATNAARALTRPRARRLPRVEAS